MQDKRYYTIIEAHNFLPGVKRTIMRLMKLRHALDLIDAVGIEYDDDFNSFQHDIKIKVEKHKLYYELYKGVDALAKLGIIVKDLRLGIVDFYAMHEGREVFLCWRISEDSVEYWHEINDGYNERRRIEELLES